MTQYGKELRSLIQKILRKFPGKEAPHIPVLPQEFLSSTMEGYADDGSCYRVGLEMEEVILKGFDRAAGLFVIIGNTGTGKTNMLRVLADQAVSRGRACLSSCRCCGAMWLRLCRWWLGRGLRAHPRVRGTFLPS